MLGINKVKTVHTCEDHGQLTSNYCPECLKPKCEHGITLAGHCNKCSADTSWASAPITDEELSYIKQAAVRFWGEFGFRTPKKPRNYTSQPLMPKLLAEYEALRAASLG